MSLYKYMAELILTKFCTPTPLVDVNISEVTSKSVQRFWKMWVQKSGFLIDSSIGF